MELDLRRDRILLSNLVGEVRDRHLLDVHKLKEVGVDHVANASVRRRREVRREVDEVRRVHATDTENVLNEVALVRVVRHLGEANEVELRIDVVAEGVVVHHDDVRATVGLAAVLRALTVQLADLADAVRREAGDRLVLVEVEVRRSLGDVLHRVALRGGREEVEETVRDARANASGELTIEGREARKLRAVDGDASRRAREEVLLHVNGKTVHRDLGVLLDELDRTKLALVLEEFLLRDVDRENHTVELDLVLLALLVPSHVQRLVAVEDTRTASGGAAHDGALNERAAISGDATLLLKGTVGGDVLEERADQRTLEVSQRGVQKFDRNSHCRLRR